MDNTNNKTEVFCASCGAKMPAGTKFCVACGKPVGAPAAPNPNSTDAEDKVRYYRWIICGSNLFCSNIWRICSGTSVGRICFDCRERWMA